MVGAQALQYAVVLFVFGLIMPGIDNYAHAGGFLGGYLASMWLDPLKRERMDHTVVALACLDNGMDPKAIYQVQPNPADPAHGIVYVGRRAIRDTAPPGQRRVFLTEVRDAQGSAVTLTYDAQYRLVALTDALGQVPGVVLMPEHGPSTALPHQ